MGSTLNKLFRPKYCHDPTQQTGIEHLDVEITVLSTVEDVDKQIHIKARKDPPVNTIIKRFQRPICK